MVGAMVMSLYLSSRSDRLNLLANSSIDSLGCLNKLQNDPSLELCNAEGHFGLKIG